MLHNVHGNLHNHCLLVPTDLTLTTDRLTELFQSVDDYMVDYIGELLGLPQSALEETRRSYQSKAKRKDAYLDTYTHRHPCPSWKKISEVLRRRLLRQQADEVENTYVQGMHVHRVNQLLCHTYDVDQRCCSNFESDKLHALPTHRALIHPCTATFNSFTQQRFGRKKT